MNEFDFYKGKKVFITGHTGFKGSWLCHTLNQLGANVVGYSLKPPTDPSLYNLTKLDQIVESIEGDVRNLDALRKAILESKPEIVIHMAAQPLVRESYINPVETYEINVMGTVNILESIRGSDTVRSFVNVTTDKVYNNKEWTWGYRENEELNGYDPYSNSKSCSELVTSSYKKSFFQENGIAISTVRAGNVIGGGDFATDRIIPDCVRAVWENKVMEIRNPHSTRPYQFVLEPLLAYLMVAQKQYDNIELADAYNVGPDEDNCVSTERLVGLFEKLWNCKNLSNKFNWICQKSSNGPHEANFLKLDSSKIKSQLGWHPTYSIEEAVEMIVDWTSVWLSGNNINECVGEQVKEFLEKGGI